MNIFEQQLLAHRIALDFVRADGLDLNKEIAKVAEERELSRLHIQGLVSAVNHAANDMLRKQAEDKTYTFALAGLDEVLRILGDVGPEGVAVTKVAALLSPEVSSDFDQRLTKLAQALPQDNTTSRKEVLASVDLIKNKLSTARRSVEAEKISNLAKLAEQLDIFTRQVGDYIVNGSPMEDLHKFASIVSGSDAIGSAIVVRAAERLDKLGHPFKGLLAKATELGKECFTRNGATVPDIKVSVVNGDAPITKTVKEIKKSFSELSETEAFLYELASLTEAVSSAERSLKDNSDVTAYIADALRTVRDTVDKATSGSIDKTAFIPQLAAGARALSTSGRIAGRALPAISRAVKTMTGKGLLRNTFDASKTVARAVPAAAGMHLVSKGLEAGQAVAARSRRGLAGSAGMGAADSSTIYQK